jgi:hypothetical protein
MQQGDWVEKEAWGMVVILIIARLRSAALKKSPRLKEDGARCLREETAVSRKSQSRALHAGDFCPTVRNIPDLPRLS